MTAGTRPPHALRRFVSSMCEEADGVRVLINRLRPCGETDHEHG